LDPLTGEQMGNMLLTLALQTRNEAAGFNFLLREVFPAATMPRPALYASESEWIEAAGNWFTQITAEANTRGKVRGTGQLVFGDPEDPLATVAQRVSGRFNSRSGVVTLNSVGTERKTSKVKLNLSYTESTSEAVADKSSISAYGQKRKF
jgi:hypothetical protein